MARAQTLRDEIRQSGETPVDEAAAAARADLDDLGFLAREFLTWLVYHADADGGAFSGEGDVADFTIGFGGRLTLRSPAGPVTDLIMKGASPSTSADLRYALAGGLAVKEAELVLEQGERAWSFSLAAEGFDLRRVQLPALLTDEDDDRADERLALLAALDGALRVAFGHFVALRLRPAWSRSVVPAMRKWLEEGT
jgi:hypothetical protein